MLCFVKSILQCTARRVSYIVVSCNLALKDLSTITQSQVCNSKNARIMSKSLTPELFFFCLLCSLCFSFVSSFCYGNVSFTYPTSFFGTRVGNCNRMHWCYSYERVIVDCLATGSENGNSGMHFKPWATMHVKWLQVRVCRVKLNE